MGQIKEKGKFDVIQLGRMVGPGIMLPSWAGVPPNRKTQVEHDMHLWHVVVIPSEKKVESATSQSSSGNSVDISTSADLAFSWSTERRSEGASPRHRAPCSATVASK